MKILYAIKKDKTGYRSIFDKSELMEDEYLSETEPDMSELNDFYSLKDEAFFALEKANVTIIRCYERSIKVPTEWADYCDKLRQILALKGPVKGLKLPERPKYPSGT